ncbi:BZ3500_MvSof-1268-A1-R1_Chr1-3g01920 [Microbotryum saponariae]|uniref:BZ3500_MvSof-1268-A1-R1_Chr1-3g01920 protein n=1 Tax=Microbotryum saponariae TaxID=289078 RepID=A0A2X0MR24_9BASI|nr:BZ3500_MvSof-1268-A1-R1_Chr1-3g01920 [Microbotryum saponariae]SCZ94904.1 BZ3501_MvSof-1269-A2-R1_Chr1-3g01522 [Microbotryum saponariae]
MATSTTTTTTSGGGGSPAASLTNFFNTHRRAVLVTLAVTIGATGAYYYSSSAPSSGRGRAGSAGRGSASSSSSNKNGGEGSGSGSGDEAAKKRKKKSKKPKTRTATPTTADEGTSNTSSSQLGIPSPQGEGGEQDPSEADIEIMDPEQRTKLALTLKAKGNKLYSGKKYSEAIACYSRAIACEEQAVFYSNRAACYTNLNEQENVIEDCTSALRLDPSYIKALNRRATAHESIGGIDHLYQALCDFTAAAIIDNFSTESTQVSVERVMKKLAGEKATIALKDREPRLPSPTFIKAYLEAFRPQPDPEDPEDPSQGDQTLKLAFEALHAKDFVHALSYFNEAIEQGISTNEGKAAALNMRATFRFIMSDAPAALVDLDEATSLSPTGTQSWVKKASVHMELGQPEEAFRDFDRASAIDPENADVYYHRGQVYFITGEFDKAITEYRRSSEIDPSFIFSHIQLAVANYKNEAVEKAMHQFRKFLKDYPRSPEVFNYYGELLLDQQKYEEAVQNFEKSIQLDKNSVPRNALPLVNKALAVFQWKQDFAQAEKICREALEIGKSPLAFHLARHNRLTQNVYPIAVDEQCDVAVATLAQLLLQQNKVHDAVKMFELSAQVSRTEPELINALTYECATRAQIAFIDAYPSYAEKLGLNRSAPTA